MCLKLLAPILAQVIRPLSVVEREAKSASSPPGDCDLGEVGLAKHRGVGAPLQLDEDGVTVVGDEAACGQEPALERVGGGVVVAGVADRVRSGSTYESGEANRRGHDDRADKSASSEDLVAADPEPLHMAFPRQD